MKAAAKGPSRGRLSRTGAWAQRLRGKSLHYVKLTGEARVQKRISFCSNGDAIWGAETGYVSGSFSSAGAHGGVWTVRGDRMTIAWNDGTAARWKLEQGEESVVRMNGKDWHITDESVCR